MASLPGTTRRSLVLAARAVFAAVAARTPRDPVRMAAPFPFGVAHPAGVLPAFERARPGIVLDPALGDRRVDLVAGAFDPASRINEPKKPTLPCRRPWAARLRPVAFPARLDAAGRPGRRNEIARPRVLGDSGGGGGRCG